MNWIGVASRWLRALLKFLGRWLGPVLIALAAYIYLFHSSPFGDLSSIAALAGGLIAAIACIFMREPNRQRLRKVLAVAALGALVFAGWRHWEFSSSFHEEIVSFDNRGARLVGTLYLPERQAKVPGIVLVHGSGPAPRILNQGYASYFAHLGYAVLSYDKRGIGDSSGRYEWEHNYCPDNLDLLASDASAALSLVAKRPEVNADAVGFVGASQAGWTIPRAAVLNGHAAFMLLLAGPTTSTHAIVRHERLRLGPQSPDGPGLGQLIQAFRPGGRDVPDGLTPDEAYARAQRTRVDFPCPDLDPMVDLRKLDIPGLWLLGEEDWIVPFGPTARNLEILRKLGKPYEYRKIPGAGHMLTGQKSLMENTIETWLTRVEKAMSGPT